MSLVLPAIAEEFTVDDLDDRPDDGRRYELLGGQLIVTPAPSGPHQTIVVNLWWALRLVRPAGTAVLVAPFDVVLEPTTLVQPDVIVVARDEATKARTLDVPLLVVEVLSRTTRATDLGSKRLTYERLGVPSYWVVDPAGPSIVMLELSGGSYAEVVNQTGGSVAVERPFVVTIDLASLAEP